MLDCLGTNRTINRIEENPRRKNKSCGRPAPCFRDSETAALRARDAPRGLPPEGQQTDKRTRTRGRVHSRTPKHTHTHTCMRAHPCTSVHIRARARARVRAPSHGLMSRAVVSFLFVHPRHAMPDAPTGSLRLALAARPRLARVAGPSGWPARPSRAAGWAIPQRIAMIRTRKSELHVTTGHRLFCQEFQCFNTTPCRHICPYLCTSE